MAEVFLEVLLENLNSLIQKELGLFFGAKKDMVRLSCTLSAIKAVLEDAEEKQLSDTAAIRDWLHKLKRAAHHLDDVLDEISTESLRLEYQGKHEFLCKSQSSSLSSLSPKNVWFRYKIAKKMKDIREALDDIAQERIKFHLSKVKPPQSTQVMEWRETTSNITQREVYGRDVDKEKIVDFLIGDAFNSEDLSVFTIVGLSGLGKTTLAQLVFNDDKISDHFELKKWVCVSEDFSLKTLFKAIIDDKSADSNLESLKTQVQEKLQKKRYLLVLDDVWNADKDKWDKLKSVFTCGSKGASIVVTTRLLNVASIMSTLPPHELSKLSDDNCWSLFKECAFGMGNEERTELEPIGKEIVKKCGGVPLAAKTLGGLLRFTTNKEEWLNIKESKLWDLPQSENFILPSLTLSYLNLPLDLRQCFAYCAIFPKDFFIEKELLIHLWMANGFILAEDIGGRVCHELCWRSLFQDAGRDEFGNIVQFTMHDLVHDLAQWVMMETRCITYDSRMSKLPRSIDHLSFYRVVMPSDPCALSFRPPQSLRTFASFDSQYGKTTFDLVKFHCLRVLHMDALRVVPPSIGRLKHLRYLNLSDGSFKILPISICSLWNLQVLNLDYCKDLQELPINMKYLKALRHLCMKGCTSLSSTPPEMGQLTSLRTLSIYIVSNNKGFSLAELKYLKLKGELHIKHLERLTSVMDAKEANLEAKQLDHFFLSWGRNGVSELQENVEQILEALEPDPQLKYLRIGGYKGKYFSNWMSSPSFKDLCSIQLIDCTDCLRLPALGKLPSLKKLRIHYMNHVQFIDNESYDGGRITRGFKSLQSLTITNLPNLVGLSKEECRDMFPSLLVMEIGQCPKLVLPHLPSVTKLVTNTIAPLSLPSSNEPSTRRLFMCSIHSLHGLQYLRLTNDEELTSLPDGMLQDLDCLKELYIFNYSKLEALQGLEGLHSLQTLGIHNCAKLKRLSTGLQYLTSLKNLKISGCREVEDLAEALQHVAASLQSLEIDSLPKLEPLPDWLGNLTSLQCPTVFCRRKANVSSDEY